MTAKRCPIHSESFAIPRTYPVYDEAWFSFEYCQSARSSMRTLRQDFVAKSLQKTTYCHQNSKLYWPGTSIETVHNARKSMIGYGSRWKKWRMTDAVGHCTPSNRVRSSIRARSVVAAKA